MAVRRLRWLAAMASLCSCVFGRPVSAADTLADASCATHTKSHFDLRSRSAVSHAKATTCIAFLSPGEDLPGLIHHVRPRPPQHAAIRQIVKMPLPREAEGPMLREPHAQQICSAQQ